LRQDPLAGGSHAREPTAAQLWLDAMRTAFRAPADTINTLPTTWTAILSGWMRPNAARTVSAWSTT